MLQNICSNCTPTHLCSVERFRRQHGHNTLPSVRPFALDLDRSDEHLNDFHKSIFVCEEYNKKASLRHSICCCTSSEDENEPKELSSQWCGDDIDQLCQKLFPMSFTAANLLYWSYFSYQADQD
jgi:hypothetical protein